MLLNCCCYCHCCRVRSYDDAKATHRASSETWSWHVKVNIQSLLLCPISDSHSRIFLQPFTSLDIFLPASSFFHLPSLSPAISPNACAGVCASRQKKILFGYSYVNWVSQQEKSKCVTMRYAHKIRVYGSKTFYRSRVRVWVCTCIHVEIIWYRSHCVCMMALFENMHVLTRITYMSMKNMKSPSAGGAAMALENTNETWATKLWNMYMRYYLWKSIENVKRKTEEQRQQKQKMKKKKEAYYDETNPKYRCADVSRFLPKCFMAN